MAGVKGFEPLIYSLGGCRLVLARLHAHDGFLEGETRISRFPMLSIRNLSIDLLSLGGFFNWLLAEFCGWI